MPLALFNCSIRIYDLAVTVLASVDPFTFEAPTISHVHNTRTIFLIVLVHTLMTAAVWIAEHALTMHLVGMPRAFIDTTIAPCVAALTLDIVVLEVSEIIRTIAPSELAFSLFSAPDILTLVAGTVAPCFDSISMLLVIFPLTCVLRTVVVQVFSLSVSFIVAPIAHVDVTIGMDKSSDTVRLPVKPLTFIERTVKPYKSASSHPHFHIGCPLTGIDDSIFHTVGFFMDEYRLSIISNRQFNRWSLKRTLAIINLFDPRVEKESCICYSRVKDATLLLSLS